MAGAQRSRSPVAHLFRQFRLLQSIMPVFFFFFVTLYFCCSKLFFAELPFPGLYWEIVKI